MRRRTTVEEPPERLAKLEARVEGFSLEAGRHVHQNDRQGLERLTRYMARPPLSMERLSRQGDGGLVLRLKRPLADRTTPLRLSPMELIRRLAALVPPIGFHSTAYHGIFAARSRHRAKIVPPTPREAPQATPPDATDSPEDPDRFPPFPAPQPRQRYLSWAELLRRTRGVDVLRCAQCGGKMEILAFVTDPDLAAEILARLGLTSPARGPPN